MQVIFLKYFLPLFFGALQPVETAHQLFYQDHFDQAAEIYLQRSEDPESLFYASVCFEKMGQKEKAFALRETLFQKFPTSSFGEESLFFNLLEEKNPNLSRLEGRPYLAYFLLSRGGKENLLKCLTLLEKPTHPYFLELKHRAYLELASLEWEERHDPLHLEYGLAFLRQSTREASPPSIEQERDYLFALFYSETSQKQAIKWIDRSIKKYENEKIVKNPYLFKLLKLKGQLLGSMKVLNLAEGAFLPNQTSEEELLDLWLTKAYLFFRNHEEDAALNQLAAIINSPVASIKRVEAMVLRQEVFTRMGRTDLAARHSTTVNQLRKELGNATLDRLSK